MTTASALELWTAYRLRWKRRRLLWRAVRSRSQLHAVANRTGLIRPGDILATATIRNEMVRLPYFLDHHRRLGVRHFLIVENASDDGTTAYLRDQPDVSLWTTSHSYKSARFGVDWLTWLQLRYAHGHWCLTLDADEVFIYPYWDTRDLRALTDWLEANGARSFAAMMLDLYPRGQLGGQVYVPGADPFKTLCWFDRGNYGIRQQAPLGNLWIQGGVRARCFFDADPRRAPTLNKTPLVKWDRRYAYVTSTHALLPRHLNGVYDTHGGEVVSGILLHSKFLPLVVGKSREEQARRQHFSNSALYDGYYNRLGGDPDLWCAASSHYTGWRQLEAMGLMSRGGWV